MTNDEPKWVISIYSSNTGETNLAQKLRRNNCPMPGTRPICSGAALPGILSDCHDGMHAL